MQVFLKNQLGFSLKTIYIPSSTTSIGDYAFYVCLSLIQITIPSSVNNIGEYGFYRCLRLAKITIPSSGCSSLTQIPIQFSNRDNEILKKF